MNPAYSVLIFTTTSGAGYGLLIWLGVSLMFGDMTLGSGYGFVMLILGLVLVTVGLLTSTLHLGRPERAIKAFSQWRTSWLSREGVAAVATYVPAGLLMVVWFMMPGSGVISFLLALLLVAGSVVTVWCTGQIYASLPTIQAWSHPLVPWGYIVLALGTGGILFVAVSAFAANVGVRSVFVTLVLVLAGWWLKTSYWDNIDRADKSLTAADAVGLAHLGKMRVLEPAHTQPNFVMREMGYKIARDHAERIRQICVVALFVVPGVAMVLCLVAPQVLAAVLGLVAVLSAGVGVFLERWLFFAEAQHIVTLYYGEDAA